LFGFTYLEWYLHAQSVAQGKEKGDNRGLLFSRKGQYTVSRIETVCIQYYAEVISSTRTRQLAHTSQSYPHGDENRGSYLEVEKTAEISIC
jgi:hypothetical protein